MSKRKTIDTFFQKKDVSNSEFRTLVAVEINVDTSMPNEHPSKCSRIQSEEIDCDPRSCKQVCEFPINKQDEIRRAYLKEGPYQPKNIDYSYNDDNHRRRKSTPYVKNLGYAPDCCVFVLSTWTRCFGVIVDGRLVDLSVSCLWL